MAASPGDRKPIVCLMGATASGKTDCAIEIADRLPVHLVSVDSVMVFRGMNIGTGKPDSTTLQQYPHALVDILDPADPWSAGEFVRLACEQIAQAHRQGRIPLLVGGTMLYFHVLLKGLAAAPPVEANLRLELQQRAEIQGWPALHAELQRLDPQSAERIGIRDARRLQRALGVVLQTGASLTDWQQRQQPALPADTRLLLLATDRPREVLYERLQLRLQNMLQAGLIGEVEQLHSRTDLQAHTPAMRAIGYRQVWQYLNGHLNRKDMEAQILIATRKHLRRQLNWMQRFDTTAICADGDSAANNIRNWL